MASDDDDVPPVDNRGGEVVVEIETPPGMPNLGAIAMTVGASTMEHQAWLHQRYNQDDGLGYDRQELAAHAATAHLARLHR